MSVLFDGSFQNSLGIIREAYIQLHMLKGMSATAAVLASQIKLCDVLLAEISGIRNSLARDLGHARSGPQRFKKRPMVSMSDYTALTG